MDRDLNDTMEINETSDHSEKKRPKRSPLCGLIALGLFLLGLVVVGYMGFSGWRAYASGNLAAINVGLMLKLLGVSVIIDGLALILSIVTLFLRGQKKWPAILALVLSLLLLVFAGGARYTYYSLFESKSFDSEFSDVPEEELYFIPELHQN